MLISPTAYSLPTTNRFTPTATQVEAKSPPTAQTQRSGNVITPKSLRGPLNPRLDLRLIKIALRYGVQLPILERRLNAITYRHTFGDYGQLHLYEVEDFLTVSAKIAEVTGIIRKRITSIPQENRHPFLTQILLELG